MTRVVFPAMERNRDAVLTMFSPLVPQNGTVLEVGSGPGAHGAFFCHERSDVTWQPTDLGDRFASVEAWRDYFGVSNMSAPSVVDLLNPPDKLPSCDALFCMNTIHIAPSECVDGLFEVAARAVNAGGVVFLYGPFKQRGVPLETSNQTFDAYLRERFPGGGLRELEDVVELAATRGFTLEGRARMPANNWSLWLRATSTSDE